MTKDQKKNVRALIKALRGGKYKQTRGWLRDKDGFCCLGVACDIFDNKKWANYLYMDRGGILPDLVREHYGFAASKGANLPFKGKFVAMTDLNDEHNQSFKQIALRLERWLAKQPTTK